MGNTGVALGRDGGHAASVIAAIDLEHEARAGRVESVMKRVAGLAAERRRRAGSSATRARAEPRTRWVLASLCGRWGCPATLRRCTAGVLASLRAPGPPNAGFAGRGGPTAALSSSEWHCEYGA